VKDSPAYGARNVSKVAAGTGEALPGPMTCGQSSSEAAFPITGDPGKWARAAQLTVRLSRCRPVGTRTRADRRFTSMKKEEE
jgi:hypothetical protein